MKIAGHDIGICSWSLRPNGVDDLVTRTKQLGLSHLQLALGPLLKLDESEQQRHIDTIRSADIEIVAGMIGFPGEDYSTIAIIRQTGGLLPDADWPQRREIALAAGQLAKRFGIARISTHIGFVPPSNDPRYADIKARVCEVAQAYGESNIELLMETGQERAPALLQFLNDVGCRNVHVNFDPANMILYGAGDPIDAIRVLGRHIQHVHVKDARYSDQPGINWGDEVPFGQGQVPPRDFLRALRGAGYLGPLTIEREAGPDRMDDAQLAIESLQSAADSLR